MVALHKRSFDDLGLSGPVLGGLSDLGYDLPTPFQQLVIPSLLARRDLFGVAATGSGRTGAFALPVIERVHRDGPTYNPTALVLTPSREQAIKVHEEFFQLTSRGTIASALGVFEGKPVTSQIGPLKHGVDIVVGTPARVLEHVKRRTLRIEQLKILVLTEVDQLLEAGLGRDVEAIVAETPKKTRQTIITSGTAPLPVISMGRQYLRDPELVGVDREEYESVETPAAVDGKQVNIYFGAGSKAGVTPRDLVGAMTNEGGLDGAQIGAIEIKGKFSLVAVPASAAANVVRKMKSSRIKGRKVKIRLERFKAK